IQPTQQRAPTRHRINPNARIVSARHIICADRLSILSELSKLQPIVAAHAGIGGAAPIVFGDEVVDDAAEILLKVQYIKRNVERRGNATGVGGVEDGTA